MPWVVAAGALAFLFFIQVVDPGLPAHDDWVGQQFAIDPKFLWIPPPWNVRVRPPERPVGTAQNLVVQRELPSLPRARPG